MKLKVIPIALSVLLFFGGTVNVFGDYSIKENANVSAISDLLDSKNKKSFNFTKVYKDSCTNVGNNRNHVPIYSDQLGYGFVYESLAMPPRKVDIEGIEMKDNCFAYTQKDESRFKLVDKNGEEISFSKSTTHNFGGMIFRVKVPAGGYKIDVEVTGGKEDTSINVSAMQAARVDTNEYWDAAKLVPVKNKGTWNENIWSFNYANGMDYIDIEIEPLKANNEIGVVNISVTPISVRKKAEGEKTTVYTLGDSTLKSYTFDEAPMSGWGQVFDRLFDLEKADVINYSMGGRSMKSMYQEGRLNDILMSGKKGDYILIQSGHNDERNGTDIGTADGENARFGGGSTEEMYKRYITDFYIPAIKARGMIPILVTPMTRIKGDAEDNYVFKDSFTNRKFPQIMRETAEELDVILVDLNKRSVEYANEIGVKGIKAIVMSLEAGETPGKTNSGSYANGHPQNKIDGTHLKEALIKQYARIISEEIYKNYKNGRYELKSIVNLFTNDVKDALETDNWEKVYPEVCNDTISGDGAYYRDQIEKLVQLGIMQKDDNGKFNPDEIVTAKEFAKYTAKLWNLDEDLFKDYKNETLTREIMASIVYDAYIEKFDEKPKYMTDYNGSELSPDDPNYDSNLIGEKAQYYPLAGIGTITDTDKISKKYKEKVIKAYELGLIRSDFEIERGKMKNGVVLEPKKQVTRAKAAKELYFMWVLSRPINGETDWIYQEEN